MRTLAVAAVVVALFGAFAWHQVRDAEGNASVLLRISPRAFDSNPLMRGRTAIRESLVLERGYDAQFHYFAAFDPLLTRFAHAPGNYVLMMDMAPYRYSRIGHVWLTRAIAGARWRSYPLTFVLTNLMGCAIVAWALSWLARQAGHSPWWGLLAAAVPGFWQSVQNTLPEPLAAGATLVGFICWQRGWWATSAMALACAVLTRETSAIAVLMLTAATWTQGRHRIAVGMAAAALAPYAVWKLHIGTVLFPVFGTDAWFFNPGTIDLPLRGIITTASAVASGGYHATAPELARAAIGFILLALGAATVALTAAWRLRTPVTIIAAAYASVALCLSGTTVWNHVGNAQRTTYELFVWLAAAGVMAPVDSVAARRWLIGLAVASAAYILFLAPDSSVLRAALMRR